MSDKSEISALVALPGILEVVPVGGGKSIVRVGPSAGWLPARGIGRWEKELSFVRASDLTAATARALRATLPIEQIAPKRYPLASKAAATAPFLPIAGSLVADARLQGLRVHTVGVDRVSAGFYYFAEGGEGDAVHVQGNLVEMLGPSLTASTTNAQIEAYLELLIDRLLVHLSDGLVSELDVELADALPRLTRDGTGLTNVDLDAFESRAQTMAKESTEWERSAVRMVDNLRAAEKLGQPTARIPLFAEAWREVAPPLELLAGDRRMTLPERARWSVMNSPRAELTTSETPRADPMPWPPGSSPRPAPSHSAEPLAAAGPMRARAPSEPRATPPDGTLGVQPSPADRPALRPTPAMAFGITAPAVAPRPSTSGRSRQESKPAMHVLTPAGPWTTSEARGEGVANASIAAREDPTPGAGAETRPVRQANAVDEPSAAASSAGERSAAGGALPTASPPSDAAPEGPMASDAPREALPMSGAALDASRTPMGAEGAAPATLSSSVDAETSPREPLRTGAGDTPPEEALVKRSETSRPIEGASDGDASSLPAAALTPAGIGSPWRPVAWFALLVVLAILFLALRFCGHGSAQ